MTFKVVKSEADCYLLYSVAVFGLRCFELFRLCCQKVIHVEEKKSILFNVLVKVQNI